MATKKKKKPAIDARIAPTVEAQRHALFASAGMRYVRIPVIDTMRTRGQLNDRQYQALAFYRDQASLAERSPMKSCLDVGIGGDGDIAVPAVITSALLTTARIERELGSLTEITRAVAVNDTSLAQWCINKFGGRERYDGKGKFVAVVPVREKHHMEMALLELRMAALRIVA